MRTRALANAALVVALIAAVGTPAAAGWRSHARDHGRDCEQDEAAEPDHDQPVHQQRQTHQRRFDQRSAQPGDTGSHPYWGTMQPYWGPTVPSGTLHSSPRTNDLKKK